MLNTLVHNFQVLHLVTFTQTAQEALRSGMFLLPLTPPVEFWQKHLTFKALKSVADAVYDYLVNTNVQLGGSYHASQVSTVRVDHGADVAAILFNADNRDEIAFGPSTTQLLANLARSISPLLKDTDEIIITPEHEGLWRR